MFNMRHFQVTDFPLYLKVIMHDELFEQTLLMKPADDKMAYETFVNYMLEDSFYGIFQDEILVGYLEINIQKYHKKGILSIVIGPEYQHLGYANEAIQWILEKGFKELKLEKTEAVCFKENYAAAHLFKHLGFFQEGCIRKEVYDKGYYRDNLHFGITKEDYLC